MAAARVTHGSADVTLLRSRVTLFGRGVTLFGRDVTLHVTVPVTLRLDNALMIALEVTG